MDLKELLGEELYKQVMEKTGDKHKVAIVSDGNWFPKEKFDGVNTENKELKKQLTDRDNQLKDLSVKAAGNEDLVKKIDELQAENKRTADEYQTKLQEQTFNFALKDALAGAKAKNPKAVEALLNKEAIKLDGDKLLGLDEQLKAIRESDAYLFDGSNEPNDPKPHFSNGNHQRQSGNAPASLAEALNQKFLKQ